MVMPGKRRRPRWLAVPFLCLLAAPAPVAGQDEIDFWDSPFVSFQAADIDQRVQQLASEKLPRNAELLVKQHEACRRLNRPVHGKMSARGLSVRCGLPRIAIQRLSRLVMNETARLPSTPNSHGRHGLHESHRSWC